MPHEVSHFTSYAPSLRSQSSIAHDLAAKIKNIVSIYLGGIISDFIPMIGNALRVDSDDFMPLFLPGRVIHLKMQKSER